MSEKPTRGPGEEPVSGTADREPPVPSRDDIESAWNSARHRRDMMEDGRQRHRAPSLHWQEGPLPVLHQALDGRDYLLCQAANGSLHLAVMHAPDPEQGAWRFTGTARAADVVRWALISAPAIGPPPANPLETKAARRRS
jgi:hypothetical protein